MTATHIPDKIPYVGIGCIVIREGQLLLVQNQRGFWSTPGGHLDFGESPDVCAARETLEETGISVTNVEFVAITNDETGTRDAFVIAPLRHQVFTGNRATLLAVGLIVNAAWGLGTAVLYRLFMRGQQ